MKNTTSYFFIALFILISSCATTAYFKTPNDVWKTTGTVYMEDGTEKKGLISILFENGLELKQNVIQFIPTDGTIEEDINITEINHYAINGTSYFPKQINLYFLGLNHLLFVERLTPENSRMNLYQLHQGYKSNTSGQEGDYYFISLATSPKYEVVETTSIKLVPDFDVKMSALVKDCPTLVDKIQLKAKGYNYASFSFGSGRLETIKRIVKEYNECK